MCGKVIFKNAPSEKHSEVRMNECMREWKNELINYQAIERVNQ